MIPTSMVSLGLFLTIVYVHAYNHIQVLLKHAGSSNGAAKTSLPSSLFNVGTETEQPILPHLSQLHRQTSLIRRLFTMNSKAFQQLDS